MINEIVLAINPTTIETISGKKTPMGNRRFEVGESVWTDGPFAFGTERYSGMVMPIAPETIPLELPYIVEFGYIDGDLKYAIRDCSTNEIKIVYSNIVTDLDPVAFCYSGNGKKFATFSLESNIVSIRTSTPEGVTTETVTLPYEQVNDNTNHYIDCYYDDYSVLHWTILWNDYSYEHYYEGSETTVQTDTGNHALINNSSGQITFLIYAETTLQSESNCTSTIKNKLDAIWQEAYNVCIGNGLSYTSTIIQYGVANNAGAYQIPTPLVGYGGVGWVEMLNDSSVVTCEVPVIPRGKRTVVNRPDTRLTAYSFSPYSMQNKKIGFSTSVSPSLMVRGAKHQYLYNKMSYAAVDNPLTTWVNGFTRGWSPAVVGRCNITASCIADENSVSNIYDFKQVTTQSVSDFNTEHWKMANVWGEVSQEYIYESIYEEYTVMRTDTTYTGETRNSSNQPAQTYNMDYGYSIEAADGTAILKDGLGWTLDIGQYSYYNATDPFYVSRLPDANKILLYTGYADSLYLIDKSANEATEIHGDTLYNSRAPTIKASINELAAILSKK